jgi:hypothetical protein
MIILKYLFSVLRRIIYCILVLIHILLCMTLVIPMIYFILTGKNWLDLREDIEYAIL